MSVRAVATAFRQDANAVATAWPVDVPLAAQSTVAAATGQPVAKPVVSYSSVLDACHALFEETVAQGHGGEDMVAVLRAIEARTTAGL
ncbi:hypothetical protein GCM10010121_072510 [Streptomyces brasiliensis]|uniref:Uncharacterized protein n=1 Tax=Streptomyces brasiliensis TaxID=1954 RepID=A0A917LAS4_9ACTN|nr:hypothetical protein GCM10010121_072510 [Streptomyces brasiliensis]